MAGAAMTTHGTYAEAICDGHHLNPIAVHALVNAVKGYDHTVLITDCMRRWYAYRQYKLGDFLLLLKVELLSDG